MREAHGWGQMLPPAAHGGHAHAELIVPRGAVGSLLLQIVVQAFAGII
jgi:hypothetical protein